VRELHARTAQAHPRWLTRSPSGLLAATVSEETDELVVVDRHGLRVRAKVGDGPSDCAFLDDDRILVSHLDDLSLRVIATADGHSVAELALGARQVRLAVSPDRQMIAVALAGQEPGLALVTVGGTDLVAHERLPLPATPDWLAFGADHNTLIVATRKPAQILRLRRHRTGYERDRSLPLVRPVVTLARNAQGTQVLLAVTDYEPQGRARLGNHFVQDQVLSLDVESMQIREHWLTARRSERQSKPGDLDRGLSPLGLAASAEDRWLVSFAGSDEVWRTSSAAQTPVILDLVNTPLHAPHSAVELRDGTLVVSSPSAGALGIFAPEGVQPTLLRLAPDDATLLAHDRNLLAQRVGERGFYEATRSGIACQSCHLHGDSDDAMHNLGGYQLVPTLSVRGLAATAPYLRDGSYPKLSDLDELAQTLYRGYLRSQGARGDTLEAYLQALPRMRNPTPLTARDPKRERRGLDAFVKARCPSCHTPPAFSNLGRIPMHSLFPEEAAKNREPLQLDVPSLLSLAASPPYLHDGRAASLEAVLSTHNRRNLHGDTQGLTAAERRDLVEFLSSL
jgi:hypothetical protein